MLTVAVLVQGFALLAASLHFTNVNFKVGDLFLNKTSGVGCTNYDLFVKHNQSARAPGASLAVPVYCCCPQVCHNASNTSSAAVTPPILSKCADVATYGPRCEPRPTW